MKRLAWMDGLRGLAAMQVVLSHYVNAFFPAIGLLRPELAHYGWETYFIKTPLSLPFDGTAAVYLFFIMSGTALTYSFSQRPMAIPSGVRRRIIRLGLPMAGALVLAAVTLSLFPNARAVAAGMTGSQDWLGAMAPLPVSAGEIAHQIIFEGMLTGYAGGSFLPYRLTVFLGLTPSWNTYIGPLWTLHIEFVGSMLILALVAIRSLMGPRVHLAVCIVFTVCFSASTLLLFVVGHVAAPWLGRIPNRPRVAALGIVLTIVGIVVCTSKAVDAGEMLRGFLPRAPMGATVSSLDIVTVFGAILIFAGIALLPALQRRMERPAIQWLGRISFSLYLTHFPLLITAASALFIMLSSSVPFGVATAATAVMGVFGSCWLASLFERWIDRPSVALSRRIGGQLRLRPGIPPGLRSRSRITK